MDKLIALSSNRFSVIWVSQSSLRTDASTCFSAMLSASQLMHHQTQKHKVSRSSGIFKWELLLHIPHLLLYVTKEQPDFYLLSLTPVSK